VELLLEQNSMAAEQVAQAEQALLDQEALAVVVPGVIVQQVA
jgi:hypothetical protein